ncbi:YbfB/YjiJ family MFS transporter [Pseudochelatococcus sp. G4_1912]|uniref:YbfB/YjiJ family MFS transporter n=1 Tax=Pseudochelatococcus sp. G4_1912 TaxID=3114288 RepID=UPI0039C695E5
MLDSSDKGGLPLRSAAGYQFSPMIIALAGMLSLASAMGIGRFAFTPLLPMMLHENLVTLAGGGWLATANYIGYFLGAALCTLLPLYFSNHPLPLRIRGLINPPVIVRSGLIATALLTLAMAGDWPWLWPALRLLSGVASAVCFVFTSTWCLQRLTQMGAPQLSGLIFCGPGVGIMATGLAVSAMVARDWHAQIAWVVFGLVAVVLAFLAWQVMRPDQESPKLTGGSEAISTISDSKTHYSLSGGNPQEVFLLTVAYGLAGFGYIITATFLPVIARHALPGSAWPDMFWPVFGLGVVFGGLLGTRLPMRWDQRDLLIGSYAVQCFGIMLGLWFPSVIGFVASSFLVGAPLTAITLFAMREVRRLNALLAASLMGLLTATYGIGQILGPPVATALVRVDGSHADFTLSLEVAATMLMVGALIFLWLRWRYPVRT